MKTGIDETEGPSSVEVQSKPLKNSVQGRDTSLTPLVCSLLPSPGPDGNTDQILDDERSQARKAVEDGMACVVVLDSKLFP
jgi:hypothetical protein